MRGRRLVPLVVLLALAALSPRAEGRGEIEAIRRIAVGSNEVEERLAQVPRLVRIGDRSAAALLGWMVERDPALWVRVGAARGLGMVRDPHAAAVLVERVQDGGPWALRRALHVSLARHRASARLLRVLDDERQALPARVLVLRALGRQRDANSSDRLRFYAAHADHALRAAALRTLVERKDGHDARTSFFGGRLAETTDLVYLRELLDVLDGALHPAMRPALARLGAHREPDIAEAARSLLERIPASAPAPPARPAAPGPEDPDARYAKPPPPPPPTDGVPPTPPPDGRRQDLVFVFDATGSAHDLAGIVHEHAVGETEDRIARGARLRVGVVVYRGGHGGRGRARGVEVLPLTYDVERALTFIRETDACGTDDRGAAMTVALREALDRMSWRWNASRLVRLFADSGCDDIHATLPRVEMHYDADRTRTAITYFLRTRGRVPPELEALAKAGGTTRLRVIE